MTIIDLETREFIFELYESSSPGSWGTKVTLTEFDESDGLNLEDIRNGNSTSKTTIEIIGKYYNLIMDREHQTYVLCRTIQYTP